MIFAMFFQDAKEFTEEFEYDTLECLKQGFQGLDIKLNYFNSFKKPS